jgi:hypothetical protein
MKTTNKLLALLVLATVGLSTTIKADEIALPVVNKPSILNEGTQTALSDAQIKELLPWAKNSQVSLKDLLENIQDLSDADKLERLVNGIQDIVGESENGQII